MIKISGGATSRVQPLDLANNNPFKNYIRDENLEAYVEGTLSVAKELFSKKCDIWFHKGYTDKDEKQVGCYVNLDGVETFSDT